MESIEERLSMNEQATDIIRELIKDGEEHDRKEILKVVLEKSPGEEPITAGTVSGVIKRMIEDKELICTQRGVYQVGLVAGGYEVCSRAIRILSKCRKDLDSLCDLCMLNAPTLSDEDKAAIKRILGMNEQIRKELDFLLLGHEECEEKGKYIRCEERDGKFYVDEVEVETFVDPADIWM